MMSYINETDFVIENKELVYPEIITDGLQLYYDAKGKRDTDYHRDTMLDMSGNKNHGKLHNFAYEKHSGYKDGLVFDYIDDKLVRPALDLQPNDFTFMLNGNIISFSPDGTVKRVQNGEVIESKGFNLVTNGDMSNGTSGYLSNTLINLRIENNELVGDTNDAEINSAIINSTNNFPKTYQNNHKYYLYIKKRHNNYYTPYSFRIRLAFGTATFEGGTDHLFGNQDSIIVKCTASGTSHAYIGYLFENTSKKEGFVSYMKDLMVIDLTEAFGAGNEPTKEQMDEIIQRFGFIPNTQDLIDRIEYKGNDLGDMENIIDGLYKTEVLSGEEVYTDKADDSVVHVEIDGKSYQYSEENLFTLDQWNSIPTSQKPMSSSVPYIELNLEPNSLYVASTNNVRANGGTGYYPVFVFPTSQNASSSTNGIAINEPREVMTGSDGILRVAIQYNEPSVVSGSYWIEVKKAPPTPDYPVQIHSLNDFDVVSSQAINMFNSKDFIKNGIDNGLPETNTTLIEVDGYSGFQHRLISYAEKYFNYLEGKFKGNTSYTLSFKYDFTGNNESAQSGIRINYTTGNGEYKGFRGLSDSGKVSIKTDPERTVKNISVGGWAHGGSFKVWKISLIKTNDFKEYIPHVKDITENSKHSLIDKINLLLDEPLRSIGDVKDRLFRDSDGLWKVERKVWAQVLDKNTVLNSSGTIHYEGSLSTNRYIAPSKGSVGYGTAIFELCTHLPHKHQVWASDDNLFGTSVNGTTQFHFRIPNAITGVIPGDSVGTRSSKISAWLESEKNNGNPFTIQYIMRNPEIEILSQSLQDKLNNLRAFSESNYVYTIDGNTNLLDTVLLLNNHWYPSSGVLQNPVSSIGQTATKEPLPVYPGAKIHLTKETTVDNFWRIVWVDKSNNVVLREVSTVNDLVLTAPNGAYGMRVSYPNGSNAVIEFDKSDISKTISENLKPTLHAKFLYNNWYKEDRVINNLMIYNRALTNEEMLQNYKTIKRRWGM